MLGRTSDGTRFLVEGSGEKIVLVHGVGMDLSTWDDVAARLALERCVIRYDMLGHGQSAKPQGPYRLADFVAQLRTLAVELSIDAITLVGFSMGGLVAQGFALAEPRRLSRLMLLNTVYDRDADERRAITQRVQELREGGLHTSIEAAIDRWFTPTYRATNQSVISAVRHRMMTNDLDAYIAAYDVFATSDVELASRVANIQCPTLVMTGENDQRSTARMAKNLAAQIPNARVKIIPEQRHLTPLEVPAIIADEIREMSDLITA